MTFLIGSIVVVLLLALVNWVACFFGCDVAGLVAAPEPGDDHGDAGGHETPAGEPVAHGSH